MSMAKVLGKNPIIVFHDASISQLFVANEDHEIFSEPQSIAC